MANEPKNWEKCAICGHEAILPFSLRELLAIGARSAAMQVHGM